MTDYIKREDAIFVALQQPFFQNSMATEIRQILGIDIVFCKECRHWDTADGKRGRVMTEIKLTKRYPHSRTEDITDAFMRGYEQGKKDGLKVGKQIVLGAFETYITADRKTEPQTYMINPQEPTNDDKCFECDDFFTCDGQCDE